MDIVSLALPCRHRLKWVFSERNITIEWASHIIMWYSDIVPVRRVYDIDDNLICTVRVKTKEKLYVH